MACSTLVLASLKTIGMPEGGELRHMEEGSRVMHSALQEGGTVDTGVTWLLELQGLQEGEDAQGKHSLINDQANHL